MNNLIRIALLGLVMLVGSVQAADPLVISHGADRATPIAVVPFGWQGGSVLPEDMSQIIGNDLRNSGYFEPIPRQNMISLPTSAAEIIYRDWQALGAQYVMVGSIVPSGARLQVQFALFNVATQQQVVAGTVGATRRDLVEAAYTLGARDSGIIRRVLLPSAAPEIAEILRLVLGWAWTYVIVAELIGSSSGIGHMITDSQALLNTGQIIFGIIVIGLIGLISDFLFKAFNAWLFPWKLA